MSKPEGLCPFCSEKMIPKVVESNFFTRDKCKCVSCDETIYVCRTPFCDDYTKGGEYYDDELCPQHGDDLVKFGKDLPNHLREAAERQKKR